MKDQERRKENKASGGFIYRIGGIGLLIANAIGVVAWLIPNLKPTLNNLRTVLESFGPHISILFVLIIFGALCGVQVTTMIREHTIKHNHNHKDKVGRDEENEENMYSLSEYKRNKRVS